MRIIAQAGQWVAPGDDAPNSWVEQFAVPALSVGTYCIPSGGLDDQTAPERLDCRQSDAAMRPRFLVIAPGGSFLQCLPLPS